MWFKRMINKIFMRLFGAKVFRTVPPLEPNRVFHTCEAPKGCKGNLDDLYDAAISFKRQYGLLSPDQISRLQKTKQNESKI